jgi:poly-beta-1,6-N-acetyl-D-glucosamine synthase
MSASNLSLVLITPARNEAQFIGNTIRSVLTQTVRPLRWVIVSDGSTDGTDEIVAEHIPENPWMELVRMPERRDRHFGAKVQCFNAGYERLKDLDYEIIGNLDADITFEPDYFAFLLERFASDPKLGVGGTPFVEGTESYNYTYTNIEHVSGACQLFRRKCFDEIGGYKPIKGGGIDWLAVTSARMKGWRTRTFVEKVCHHHRPMGTGNGSRMQAWFKLGYQEYYLGGHPIWQLFRSCFQMTRKPYLVGGTLLFCGYFWGWARRVQRPVSQELVNFQQQEQMQRLRAVCRKTLRLNL